MFDRFPARSFWTTASGRAALPLPPMPIRIPAFAGFIGRRTGGVPGAVVGTAGNGGPVSAGSPLLGVTMSPISVCGVAQRLGQAAANYSESLSRYHGDSRSDQARLDGNSETASVMNSEHT